MIFSGMQLWNINSNYQQESTMHREMLAYEPTGQSSPDPAIAQLRKLYPGSIGWLTIPHTQVNYPFAQGKDNQEFLHTDLHHNYSFAGTLFLDYRNSPDLSDFNSVIFGHHMRNGSMFGSVRSFNDAAFFKAHPTGTVYLADVTYTIEFLAFAEIKSTDTVIYNTAIETDSDKADFLHHVRTVARNYRDIGALTTDRFITLSSCDYDFANARMVLIGRLA